MCWDESYHCDRDLTPKGAGLEYRSFASNHAVLLTGVNLDADGQPDRWKIENSWGEDVGEKGYFVCSEAYFRAYGYEAVIQKKHLSEEQKQMLEKPPILVNAWDEDAGW
jgi:bleomycin hydrolase